MEERRFGPVRLPGEGPAEEVSFTVPGSEEVKKLSSSRARRFLKGAMATLAACKNIPGATWEKVRHTSREDVLKTSARGSARWATRQGIKNAVAWSGVAGFMGGGLAGTAVAGFAVGAIAGATWEYARQVNHNLDLMAEAKPEKTDLKLVGQKDAFLEKMKGLGHREAYRINDRGRMIKAIAYGAVGGAAGGALVEYRVIPQLSDFVEERMGGVKWAASKVGDGLGGVGDAIGKLDGGKMLEGIRDEAGQIAGGAGYWAGRTGDWLVHSNEEEKRQFWESVRERLPFGGAEEVKKAAEEVKKATEGGNGGGTGESPIGGFSSQKDFGEFDQQLFDAETKIAAQQREAFEKLRDDVIGLYNSGFKGQQDIIEYHKIIAKLKETPGITCAPEQPPEVCVPFRQELAEAKSQFAEKLAERDAIIAEQGRKILKLEEAMAAKGAIPSPDAAAAAAAAAKAAAEQAATQAESALENLGDSISLPKGSNPWQVSRFILIKEGVPNPSPAQIMKLDKVFVEDNFVRVEKWGIPGRIDDHKLPVGFIMKLTPRVKKVALAIASGKDTDLAA